MIEYMQKIMDKLIELKEWQQRQEELVRKRQTKQINSLNEQNFKLNALTNSESGSDGNLIDANTCTEWPIDETNASTEQKTINTFDDNHSIEELREDDNCHQMNANNSFRNQSVVSYLESSPVVPGIDGKSVKTFEQLLDLRLNSEKNENSVESYGNKPKKAFLRKGAGIMRFGGIIAKTKQIPKQNHKKDKKVCFETNEVKNVSIKTKPKVLEKDSFIKKRIDTKSEENCVKPKPKHFNRKVIPLTTKLSKNENKSVMISRNTPTVVNGFSETEFDFFDHLQRFCQNISINDNSVKDQFKDKDINELQDLLKKIEIKKSGIQRQFDSNERQMDCLSEDKNRRPNQMVAKTSEESAKTVRWSERNDSSNETEFNFESDEQMCELIEPKSGAYSSSLKQQISELEDRLSRLKSVKRNKVIDSSLTKGNGLSNPINEELIKLRQQIEKMNKRIINIESKSYDLITPQMKQMSINRKPITAYSVDRNSKTITSNISVNENPNDTTIDLPNGDRMTVSKDNTIFYSFANGAQQTTYPDGLKLIQFPNGQTEKMYKNGVKQITYANGLQRTINPDSSEQTVMTDGTVWRIQSDGSEVLEFTNGDREIRTERYKRREYKNGNLRTVYSDGTEETRYVCGRLRIKDSFGNLRVDSTARHLNQHI